MDGIKFATLIGPWLQQELKLVHDGRLFIHDEKPFHPVHDRIVVPCERLPGLATDLRTLLHISSN